MPELTARHFGFDHERSDSVLRVVVGRDRYILIGDKLLEPDRRAEANASTLALQSLFGPLVAVWLVLWLIQPGFSRVQFSGRTLCGDRSFIRQIKQG